MFSLYGTLIKCGIEWDDLGRSKVYFPTVVLSDLYLKGSAIVEFEKPADARKAIKEYNGIISSFLTKLKNLNRC